MVYPAELLLQQSLARVEKDPFVLKNSFENDPQYQIFSLLLVALVIGFDQKVGYTEKGNASASYKNKNGKSNGLKKLNNTQYS